MYFEYDQYENDIYYQLHDAIMVNGKFDDLNFNKYSSYQKKYIYHNGINKPIMVSLNN